MKNYTDEFFARLFSITPAEYGEMVERNGPGEFFRQLYGHSIGPSNGAVPEEQRPEYYSSKGYEFLENKLACYAVEHNGTIVYKDKINDYFYNSDGFRGPKDFDGTEDIVFSGCSHTFGEGIPEQEIWGVQVAKSLNMSYANISRSGGSPYWCVDAIFGYLKKYKAKPKMILALMPDFHRIVNVVNPLVSVPYLRNNEKHGKVFVTNQWIWSHYSEVPNYLKKPFAVESSMTRETSMMLNLRAIHSLEAYCEVAGIKLLWSTWAPDEAELFSNTKRYYPDVLENYIDVKARNWHSIGDNNYWDVYHEKPGKFGTDFGAYGSCKDKANCTGLKCHSELEKKYGVNFHRGTDWLDETSNPHFGIHKHTHIAEEFLKEIESDENFRN